MTITKEILKELGISNFSILFGEKTFFCMPLNISGNQWTVAIDGDFTIEGNVIVRISTDRGLMHIPGYIDIVHYGENSFCTCVHRITASLMTDEPDIQDFLIRLRELEKQKLKWNKRKEERYEIRQNISAIGLNNPEQKFMWYDRTYPCFIYNVSYSGTQIITTDDMFQTGQKLELLWSFENPAEVIQITSEICHVDTVVRQDGKLRFSVLNLHFPEPPIQWMKRMEILSRNCKKEDDGCFDLLK